MTQDESDRENWTRPTLWVGAVGAALSALLAIILNRNDTAAFPPTWEDTTGLIGQLSLWLFLVAAFAALAGWAFSARRNAPAERALRRERDNLMRDLIGMAMGEAGAANDEVERVRSEDALKGMLDVRNARIAELEQALERVRAGADSNASELAELQRRIEKAGADAQELARLRALEDARERQQLVDARVEEVEPEAEDAALQAWRLRYLEQRVRYLEGLARPEPPAGALAAIAPSAAAPDAAPQLATEWRAREAEARAAFLENELRVSAVEAPDAAPAMQEAAPFAANADIDMLLRWRLLYLERRVAHLQTQGQPGAGAEAVALAPAEHAPDPDRWKWRARYLEARVRHLEQRPAPAPTSTPQPLAAEADELREPPPPPAGQARRKPAVLSSPRDGAPDDLTLIEGVSALQQSTLYSIGVYHFDQIAAWAPDNVAWIDHYLRLRGRIDEEEWVEQAAALARELAGA
jgi:predicted flap endonuclease-1-like 5' DNA nuclease